jgi:branched-chain amino acid transport system substrate-binding protein
LKNLLLTLLLCCLFLEESTFAQSEIKIGVSLPLSGEAATFGEDIRDTLIFAREHFLDKNIKFDFQDDKCSGRGGADVAQYFVQNKVALVIGYACVESIMPAIPILEKANIPIINVLASGPEITGRSVFSLYPNDECLR